MVLRVCVGVRFGFEALLDSLVASLDDRRGGSVLSPPICSGWGLSDIDRVRCGGTGMLEVGETTLGVCTTSRMA